MNHVYKKMNEELDEVADALYEENAGSRGECILVEKTLWDKTIRVWRFADAPKFLREMSTHGGDEDWVALVPSNLENEYIAWLETYQFDNAQKITLSDNSKVYITAHA